MKDVGSTFTNRYNVLQCMTIKPQHSCSREPKDVRSYLDEIAATNQLAHEQVEKFLFMVMRRLWKISFTPVLYAYNFNHDNGNRFS